MVLFKRLRFQPQHLSHCGKQTLDRLDGGRNLATLDTADRRLVGTSPQRQAALAEAMPFPRLFN